MSRMFSGHFKSSISRLRLLLVGQRRNGEERRRGYTTNARFNQVGIQMISDDLRATLFGQKKPIDEGNVAKSREHLKVFDLLDKNTDILNDVTDRLKLPTLYGRNLDEHFNKIASKYVDKYVYLISKLCSVEKMPEMPKVYNYEPGWTKYDSKSGTFERVDYPTDSALVFDVEVLVTEGQVPTMAVAVSDTSWYSWCSERLIHEAFQYPQQVTVHDLIPLESQVGANSASNSSERIVVCHNAGFDRSFVKEQYFLEKSKLNFLDTMSMHIACSGFTSEQRLLANGVKAGTIDKNAMNTSKFQKETDEVNTNWLNFGSANNLHDVHRFYCSESPELDKELRNIFVTGTMKDVRKDFQSLMKYCANDVRATFEVLTQLFPLFIERFPHPVTLCGMLEMQSMYLPINKNWLRYIDNCQSSYEDMKRIAKQSLIKSANEACEYYHDKKYKQDPWLFNLDWNVKEFKLLKAKTTKTTKTKVVETESDVGKLKNNHFYKILSERDRQLIQKKAECKLHEATKSVLATASRLSKLKVPLANYPGWYRDLHDKGMNGLFSENTITVKTRVTPKLLRLTWNKFPLYHSANHGWGYLVPKCEITEIPDEQMRFPYEELKKICNFNALLNQYKHPERSSKLLAIDKKLADIDDDIAKRAYSAEEKSQLWKLLDRRKKLDNEKKRLERKNEKVIVCPYHTGVGPYVDETIPNGCYFFSIPHKDGNDKKVGNPLATAFIAKMKEGVLCSYEGEYADLLAKVNANMHYWVNNEKRIRDQMTIWNSDSTGAILPRTVVAGTITRRAVEPTWLTASNYKKDRIASELKPMIQCPEGYNFVGADVDSQELWIASLIGDSYFASMHGCTAIGWMTLQGKKKDSTDMHSRTANMIGISRDHAKVFNYGRIYGAGRKFAVKLLMQFNPNLTEIEAEAKARLMYNTTKGKKDKKSDMWCGGSESEMFNKLETIAKSCEPRTPALGSSITRTMEPDNVSNDFMTSRINWVVQSSAVDYLHLMLVCMKWLIDEYDIDARFSISIHDEVRYLVKSEDRYRASLALQITNLLTRSLFSYKLGLDDLPLGVAFFSEVDVDTCLRKDVNLEFVTPSNPFGLTKGYGIPKGESLDIYAIVEKTKGDLEKKHEQVEVNHEQEEDQEELRNKKKALIV